MVTRRLTQSIQEDLEKKMVWVAGPRQCGKTTLSNEVLSHVKGHYYNWDSDEDRSLIRQTKLDPNVKLWVFDELHKYGRWRNWLKGVFDKNKKTKQVLVTGSARLDLFSRGGDSLQGRYFFYRLHPFTMTEVLQSKYLGYKEFIFENLQGSKGAVEALFKFGGFPEPFLGQNERDSDRWRLGYSRRLFREDVRDLDLVKDIEGITLMYEQLGKTVSSVLSINSLREDLEVNFATAKNWLRILENLLVTFRLAPFGSNKIKAVKKEQKLYFWDYGKVQDPGSRFENLIALHLLRLCHWIEDIEGKECELRYVRESSGKETDFIVVRAGKPLFLVECKLTHREIDKNLRYFLARLPVSTGFQVYFEGNDDYELKLSAEKVIRVIPAHRFLSIIP